MKPTPHFWGYFAVVVITTCADMLPWNAAHHERFAIVGTIFVGLMVAELAAAVLNK